ncbi:MAG: hypothetical protein JSV84_07095, partial [Gemmatimonadota bacterium]
RCTFPQGVTGFRCELAEHRNPPNPESLRDWERCEQSELSSIKGFFTKFLGEIRDMLFLYMNGQNDLSQILKLLEEIP